jgi:DDE superfamily endonuclease
VAAARAAWPVDTEAGVGGIAPERLVFLDECGVLTGMARLCGRGPRGERARGAVPHGPWARLSVPGALGHEGTLAAMSVEGAASGAVFHAYLERVLLPELRRTKPDAVLVMDNLGAHKAPKVRGLLDRSGFPYRGPRPRAGAAGPGAALLLAGSEPDRAGLGAGEGRAAPGRGAHPGGAVLGARPGARPRLRRECRGLLPPLRLRSSRLGLALT